MLIAQLHHHSFETLLVLTQQIATWELVDSRSSLLPMLTLSYSA